MTIALVAAMLSPAELFSASSGGDAPIISVEVSPKFAHPEDEIEVAVSLYSGAPYKLLVYPDENKLGGTGFLSLELTAPNSAPPRFIHPSKFSERAVETPSLFSIAPNKPYIMKIALKEWFEISEIGRYSLTARFRLFGEASSKAAAITELISKPFEFTLEEWTEERIKEVLDSDSRDLKLSALQYLSQKKVLFEGLVARLESLLNNDDESLRAYAANALGNIGDPTSVRKILDSLASLPLQSKENKAHYQRALSLLAKKSKEAYDIIISTLLENASRNGANATLLTLLLRATFNINGEESAYAAVQLLEAGDKELQIAAINSVGKFKHSEEIYRLVNIYWETEDVEVKDAVLTAVGYFSDTRRSEFGFYGMDEAFKIFVDGLKSDDPALLATSARYAGMLDDARLADYLVPLLRHPNWVVRKYAYPSAFRVTGCKLPYQFDAPPKQLEHQAEKWEEWWRDNRRSFFEPVKKNMLNWVITTGIVTITLATIGYILGFLRESSFTLFMKGGTPYNPQERRIFGSRKSELSLSREKKLKKEKG
ncbi:MAG: hypothetical protein Kow0090_01350 [Myxococcota bacterium]